MAETGTAAPSTGAGNGGGEKNKPRFTGKVTIEVGDNRNHSFIWGPDQRPLRGTWLRVNLKKDEMAAEELATMPDIPGMRITVDGHKRTLTIYDPLTLPEYAYSLAEVTSEIKAKFRENMKPEAPVVREDAGDTEIKTWLYWMRRFVNGTPKDDGNGKHKPPLGGPMAKVVDGELPSLEEIVRYAGKTEIQFHNSSPRKLRYREDAERYEQAMARRGNDSQ